LEKEEGRCGFEGRIRVVSSDDGGMLRDSDMEGGARIFRDVLALATVYEKTSS